MGILSNFIRDKEIDGRRLFLMYCKLTFLKIHYILCVEISISWIEGRKRMYRKKKISLVIPAYNEQRLIKPTLENVPRLIDRVYVVNDTSTDNTAGVVSDCAKKDRRIILVNHEKNSGVGQAIIRDICEA